MVALVVWVVLVESVDEVTGEEVAGGGEGGMKETKMMNG